MKVIAWACTSSTCSRARSRRSPRARAARSSSRSGSTAAGSAAGTAVTLAKLGAEVRSAGAIGTDAVGDMLLACSSATASTRRCSCAATTCRPRRACCRSAPTASRPAFHVDRRQRHVRARRRRPRTRSPTPTHLHLGGPEFMGGEEAAEILARRARGRRRHVRRHPRPGRPGGRLLEWIAPAFAHLDYLLPNDEQVLGFTGEDGRRGRRCRALLDRGVGCVAATCGADGVVIVDADGVETRARVRHRRRRHDRLRRRVLRRLPARPLARPLAGGGRGARLRRRGARRAGPRHRPRRLRPRRGRRVRRGADAAG